jgi:hypothetical protein
MGPPPPCDYGIDLAFGSSNNLIKGNVVSACVSANIFIEGTNNNTIAGNFIGTNAAGTAAVGGRIGVWVYDGAQNNTIGGTTAADRNVISGNSDDGVLLSGPSVTKNVVEGNYIGADVTGASAIPNQYGVQVVQLYHNQQGPSNNTIGGSAPGAGNVIAFNTKDGVQVSGRHSTGNSIRGNSIFANGGLGIDLVDGGNGSQRSPQLTAAVALSNGMTEVTGALAAEHNTTYTLDFYSSPSGPNTPEGETYLGSVTVTTGADGKASFTVMLATPTTPGDILTATATDPFGDTSEFSDGTPITAG